MSEHTKGPWRLDKTGVIPIVATADGDSICQVYGYKAEAYANGRLLAAAPDLLAALERIARKAKEEEMLNAAGVPQQAGGFPWWNLGDIARAAIKKAEEVS